MAKVKQRFFDQCVINMLEYIEKRNGFSLKPSQSRWGFISVSSTIASLLIALSVAPLVLVLTIFRTCNGDITGCGFAISALAGIIGFIWLTGFVLVVCLGIYFLRNPTEPSIEESLDDINTKLKKLDELPHTTKALNKISKKLNDDSTK